MNSIKRSDWLYIDVEIHNPELSSVSVPEGISFIFFSSKQKIFSMEYRSINVKVELNF